ncbi:MAG: hypothetical protein Q7S21_03930 [archaeon]|nr:hypothetical protein [archaeon]
MAVKKRASAITSKASALKAFSPKDLTTDLKLLDAKMKTYIASYKKGISKDAHNTTVVAQLNEIVAIRNSMMNHATKNGTTYTIRLHVPQEKKAFEKLGQLSGTVDRLIAERKYRRGRTFQKQEGRKERENVYQATETALQEAKNWKNAEHAKIDRTKKNWWQKWKAKQEINKRTSLLRDNAFANEKTETARINKEYFLGMHGRKFIKSWKARRFRA